MTQDAIGDALIRALADEGFASRLLDPNTISIALPGFDDFTTDVGEWRDHVAGVPAAELPEFAAGFARGFGRAIRKQLPQMQALRHAETIDIDQLLASEALRVRIYTEEALAEPPGARDALLTRPLAPGLLETVVVDLPDSIVPLNRKDIGGKPEHHVFGAALHASLNREPHHVSTEEIWDVPIVHIGETHRYVGSHIHLLKRHLGPAPYGALVAFPVPEYLLAHKIGDVHLILALHTMQALARTHVEKGEKALTPQVYWWRPGSYEELPDEVALGSGRVPDLRPVRIEVEGEQRSTVSLHTPDTQELINLWKRDHEDALPSQAKDRRGLRKFLPGRG